MNSGPLNTNSMTSVVNVNIVTLTMCNMGNVGFRILEAAAI